VFRTAVGTVIAFAGLALVGLGLWAGTEAALGHNGGTDTQPEFGYVVGAPEVLVGLGIILIGVRFARR
jgi:hypothetical protein